MKDSIILSPPIRTACTIIWKIIWNVTKYISFLIFLGLTFLSLLSYPLDIPPGFLIPLLVCLILSLFYKFCHRKGDKTLVFILQLPWIFFLVSNIWWEPLRPPQFEENLNKGLKYYKGLGVQQDHKEAMKWFKLALVEEEYSKKSSEDAFMGDGNCLGNATDEEMDQRVRLGQRGLVQISENALGEIYEQGKGVHQNYEEAVKWYRRALSKTWAWNFAIQDCFNIIKYPKAYYNLGRMYDKGLGVPEDNYTASLLVNSAYWSWTAVADAIDWTIDHNNDPLEVQKRPSLYTGYYYHINTADHSMKDVKHRIDLIAEEMGSYCGDENLNPPCWGTLGTHGTNRTKTRADGEDWRKFVKQQIEKAERRAKNKKLKK